MKLTHTLIAVLISAVTLPALAQTATPGIDQRQANQQQRIDQGVKSGELTSREAARLEKGQERVQKMEDKAKADDVVTAKERARIQHQQDVQSRHVAREKHDRQRDMNRDGKMDRPGKRR
ncbi:MAG: hypothetical protein Q8O34_14650 [Rhodocyclaceae bacterium]|nr:hypothetical protein [Rhodocyclaceae bacterium]